MIYKKYYILILHVIYISIDQTLTQSE